MKRRTSTIRKGKTNGAAVRRTIKPAFYRIPNATKYDVAPKGAAAPQSGVEAYNKIATVCANTVGVARGCSGPTLGEASRATSLTR